MTRVFLFLGLLLVTIQGFSQTSSDDVKNHFLIFQVIQDEFTLDNSTIKNAAIVEKEGGVYGGLSVELKPEAAAIFTDITKAGVGRHLILVFNKVVVTATVIQTPLSESFLISGISKEDAQAFLNVLNANKSKPKEDEG
ncbi:MAG: hypothetical protein KIT56_02435 [Gammaproteobacteria bacterium]|nr:hypothetical protein [Gammaproteobacteria bacterium]MCW5582736.1 hypothetical protein [Gammaproteobacteria bacterium]